MTGSEAPRDRIAALVRRFRAVNPDEAIWESTIVADRILTAFPVLAAEAETEQVVEAIAQFFERTVPESPWIAYEIRRQGKLLSVAAVVPVGTGETPEAKYIGDPIEGGHS